MKTTIKFYRENSNSDEYTYVFESELLFPVIPYVGQEIFVQGQNFCVTYIRTIYEHNYCEVHVIMEEIDG